jgi:hypothetical protein
VFKVYNFQVSPIHPPLKRLSILPAGSDIRRISDPSGTGSGTKFDPWVLPVPDPIHYGSGTDLISYPWVPDGYPKIVILDFQPTSTLASRPPSTAHSTTIPPCLLMLLI